ERSLRAGQIVSLGLDVLETGEIDLASVAAQEVVTDAIPEASFGNLPKLRKGRSYVDVTLSEETSARLALIAERHGIEPQQLLVVAANAGLDRLREGCDGS